MKKKRKANGRFVKKGDKYIQKICNNCQLFNPVDNVCGVTVIYGGEYLELMVKPTDRCHWERVERELSREFSEETLIQINQVRMWSNEKQSFIERPLENFD
jgi:hypothetical protein